MSHPVLSVERLVKRFRGRTAVAEASFDVPPGSIYALLGPNGAGKTTVMRCCVGLVRPSAGRTLLFGSDSWGGNAADRRRVGGLVSSPGLVGGLSARENIRRHARLQGGDRAEAGAWAAAALADWQLERVGTTPARRLSRGEQQRVALAAAFLGSPELLLLDEPTEGLDPLAIAALRDRLVAAQARGATVVLSSHLLSEVEQCATHCAVMSEGRVRVAGAIAELSGGEARLRVRATPLDRALQVCTEGGATASTDGTGIVVSGAPADASGLVRRLVAAAVDVAEIVPIRPGLESIYRTAIGAAPAGRGPAA